MMEKSRILDIYYLRKTLKKFIVLIKTEIRKPIKPFTLHDLPKDEKPREIEKLTLLT